MKVIDTCFKKIAVVVVVVLQLLLSIGCNEQPTIEDFFYVPWPSDTRLVEPGSTILSSGLNYTVWIPDAGPKTFAINKIVGNILLYKQGVDTLEKQAFGLNSGIFFRLAEAIDSTLLPNDPLAALADDAIIMLVNIDDNSASQFDRVPLIYDFKATGNRYIASNTLAVLPYWGYTLEEDTRYAAIVFKGVKNMSASSLQPSYLNQIIDQPWDENSILTSSQHALWQEHKQQVQDYVANHTQWDVATDIAEFTVFTTQSVTHNSQALGEALKTLTDEDIRQLVVNNRNDTSQNLQILGSCDENSNSITARGSVRIPHWQTGNYPYFLKGGEFVYQMSEGKMLLPSQYEVTPVEVLIPCELPEKPRAFINSNSGGGSTSGNANHLIEGWVNLSNHENEALLISVGDYISSPERYTQKLGKIHHLAVAIGAIPERIDVQEFSYALRGAYINAEAAKGIALQVSAETYIVKRVAENFEWLVANNIDPQVLLDANLTPAHFAVDRDKAGLFGFSQGAVETIRHMAVDNSYSFAYMGSGSVLSLPIFTQVPMITGFFQYLFPSISANDINEFHPLANMLQAIRETSDSINYVKAINPAHLFMTAGDSDFYQSVPLSTQAGAIALARYGHIEATGTNTFQEFNNPIGFFDVLNQSPIIFPTSGNMANGHTGVFSLYPGGHSPGYWGCGGIGKFLYTATATNNAPIVELETGQWLLCPWKYDEPR